MKQTRRGKVAPSTDPVLPAATFKAEALAVMRRVQETGQAVTITSRGKPLVRIEPVRREHARRGYGAMRGTVEFVVSEDEIVKSVDSEGWGTLEEWDELSRA